MYKINNVLLALVYLSNHCVKEKNPQGSMFSTIIGLNILTTGSSFTHCFGGNLLLISEFTCT